MWHKFEVQLLGWVYIQEKYTSTEEGGRVEIYNIIGIPWHLCQYSLNSSLTFLLSSDSENFNM